MLPMTTCNATICTCSVCGRELAPPEMPVLLFEAEDSPGQFMCQAHCPVPVRPPYMGATWCEGCGRMVLLNASFPLRVFCSLGCRDGAQPEVLTQGTEKLPDPGIPAPSSHEGQHRPVCEMCAAPFVSTRPDAHYCSNACRQRAYRERQKLSA